MSKENPETMVENEAIEVEKNLFSVEITIPSDYAGNLAEFDEKVYLEENKGIEKAKVNEDGSLYLKMSKSKHNELVDETKINMEKAFTELVDDPETPYLKDLSWSKDFEEFSMVVDGEEWENAFDFTPFSLALSSALYQSIKGNEFHTVIKIIDVDTKEVIHEAVYPDALMDD
ncbi:MAG: hypothetical protein GX829_00040 [Clostridium sp.]|nr:hypothetical protein [Clostridium sp.]